MHPLSFESSSLLAWLFESTIYVSLLICLILIIRTVARKKLPVWWSYGLWLLLISRMLLPWGFDTPLNVIKYVPSPPKSDTYMPYLMEHNLPMPFPVGNADIKASTISAATNNSAKANVIKYDSVKTVKKNFSLSLDKAFLILWVSGLVFFSIFTFYKNLKFWTGIRNGCKIEDERTRAILANCISLLAIRRTVSIIATDKVKSPALFGYVKPRLLLPPDLLETLGEDSLRCVFLHELGHMKRHDIGISWLVTALQVIYWFNPLVWLAFHRLRTDQEIACDAYVLSKIKQVQPTDYADTIVGLLERFIQNRQLPSLAGIIENRSQIHRRIAMILNFKRYTLKMTLVSVVMLVMVGLLFFSGSRGLSYANATGGLGITGTADPDLKRYESREWHFAIDIPRNWNVFPPDLKNSPFELIRFEKNERENYHMLIVFQNVNPLQSEEDQRAETQRFLAIQGFDHFVNGEVAIESQKVLTLDFDQPLARGDGTWSWRYFYVTLGSSKYVLGFSTTKKDEMFPLYNRIAETFEIYEPPAQAALTSSDMKHYKSDDWNFSLDMPKHWAASPSPIYIADIETGQLVSFKSNEDGLEALSIFIAPSSFNEELDRIKKVLANNGYRNTASIETTIGSRKASILDFDKEVENGTLRAHGYMIPYKSALYCLVFVTTRPGSTFELYDRIAKTFEFHEAPVVEGFKKYLSPDGSMEMEIPANWKTLPPSQVNNEPIRFGTPQNGIIANIHIPGYDPWDSLENYRTLVLQRSARIGWKDFTNSETVINGRKTLIIDGNNGSTSVRGYLFENVDYKYIITFFNGTKNGMPADKLEEYSRVMKSIKIIKVNPIVATFKEYAGPDLGKPKAYGMKRYIAPEADFTVDVPAAWRPYAEVNESGKSYQFGTPENGLAAIFYPRAYSAGVTLEWICDNQVKINTNAGLKILGKSETNINGRKVLMLDSKKDSINIRNYFFKEGDYHYSVLFYAFHTEGIPADKIDEYERIMKSINILRVNTKAGAVLVQFRLGENEPGKDLEEMTAAISNQKVYLHKESVLSNADIKTASVRKTKDGFGIAVYLTEAGGKKLTEITKDNLGKIMGMVVGGKLVMAPAIRVPITGGEAFINGNFTLEEAERIASGVLGEK